MKGASRIHELRELLERANRAYYADAAPFMSDVEFDRLLVELQELEAKHPELDDPSSPTKRVGGEPVDGFTTVKHAVPMLSIDNTYSEAEVREWWKRLKKELAATRVKFEDEDGESLFVSGTDAAKEMGGPDDGIRVICEPKIDGLALSLRYEKGKLVRAVTRGDGTKGDDVLLAVRTIRAVPLELAKVLTDSRLTYQKGWKDIPEVLEIRGEVYFPLKEFERVNKERESEGDDLFLNPRNAAAGTLKQLDTKITASRKLAFLAHGRGEVSDPGFAECHSEFLDRTQELGVPNSAQARACATVEEVLEYITKFDRKRHDLPYMTDGVVVRLDRFVLQDALGTTSKSPRWVIAYKYPAERKTTTLLRVDPQVGKTGKITPRAVMEPVLLAGTVVQHATLHNYGRVRDASTDPDVPEAARTDIRLGDTVYVEKAGEIIPYVAGVVIAKRPKDAQKIVAPEKCPECKGPVEIEPPEAEEDPKLETARRCVNPECPAQVREKLIWFAGRKQMDIEGLGEKTVDQIRTEGDGKIPLNSFADIFHLHEYREKLVALDRMGEKKVENLLAGIEDAKSRGLAKVLAGMGMRHVGESTSKALARQFKDVDALLAAEEWQLRPRDAAGNKAEREKYGLSKDTSSLPETGLGKLTAPIVHAYLHSAVAKKTFRDLAAAGVDLASHDYQSPAQKAKAADAPFTGKTFVITGTLENYQRDDLKELLEKNGAKVSGSVSKNTSVLICGTEAGSKLDKAQELGVEVWEEARLLTELGKAGLR